MTSTRIRSVAKRAMAMPECVNSFETLKWIN
jgi:hypothetical protein